MNSKEDIVNGTIRYVDNEVLPKMDLKGKIVLGTMVTLASMKMEQITAAVSSSGIAKTLGIVDESGNFDIDAIANSLSPNIDKYGSIPIQIPMAGEIKLSSSDIITLKQYIKKEI